MVVCTRIVKEVGFCIHFDINADFFLPTDHSFYLSIWKMESPFSKNKEDTGEIKLGIDSNKETQVGP